MIHLRIGFSLLFDLPNSLLIVCIACIRTSNALTFQDHAYAMPELDIISKRLVIANDERERLSRQLKNTKDREKRAHRTTQGLLRAPSKETTL